MKPVYMSMVLLLLVALADGQPVPELAPAESVPPPASPDPTYSPPSAVAPDPSTSGYASLYLAMLHYILRHSLCIQAKMHVL